MKLTFLLHFYQPHDQQDDILNRIVNESYRPLVKGLLANERGRVVINISGALLELLRDKGYEDVLDNLKLLFSRGQVELTGSSMYHAFLPLIPESEIKRQIELNDRIHREVFGDLYHPVGFFSPEMAVSKKVFNVINKHGYKWIPAPQLSYEKGTPAPDKFYKLKDYDIFTLFRHKRVSSLVLSAVVRDAKTLVNETRDLHDKDKYWFCVMDAETFGHHRVGHEKVLFEILNGEFFEPVLARDLLPLDDVRSMGVSDNGGGDRIKSRKTLPVEKVDLRDCTWTNTEQDFHLEKEPNSFVLWKDLGNPIHRLQWELMDIVVDVVENYEGKTSSNYKKARKLLDRAISSDQFWWASAKPWWSLEMIELGAYNLWMVMKELYPQGAEVVNTAQQLYRAILDQAFEWQRTGYIRKKHLENSATFMQKPFKERTSEEWYNQMLLEFNDEMKKASDKKEFEKAVKWRDAILKLEQGTDMYDVLHVVDELWSARQIPSVKPFLQHDWSEFSDFVKGYLKGVRNAEEFNEWKKGKKHLR